jgi:3',5'-cyclic AMP phosphodiesterase CpdA
MSRRSKGSVVAGILLLSMIPAFITTHAVLVQGKMRIADPMIGAPQFSKPGGSIPIHVENAGLVDASSWQASLQSVDFEWAPAIPLLISLSALKHEGKHVLNATLPSTMLVGLYDLNVSCVSMGVHYSVQEPHAVCVYDAITSLRFAHLTDPHVTFPDKNETLNLNPPHLSVMFGNRTINENLRELLATVSIARPDFALLTGDIATRGLEQEFQATREILLASRVPVLCTPGNHDHRSPPSFTHFLAPMYYSRSIDAWRIICLDSGATEGNGLYGEQLKWLGDELLQASLVGQQVMIAMHSPSTIEPQPGYTVAGNAEFRALCLQYSVRGIFTGHHHYSDAYYANGSQVLIPDPIPASAGPIYVKTGSTTLDYGAGDRGLGWRFVRSQRNGTMAIGYDVASTGTSDPLEDLPLSGLVRVDGNLQVTLTNYYRIEFLNITIPVQLGLLTPADDFSLSEGTIIGQLRGTVVVGILLRINSLATGNKTITFTRV